jgi:hypothetical protein
MPIQDGPYSHRDEAARLLRGTYADAETTAAATAHALLAIEQRLGEHVVQQKLANTIAAFQSGVVAPSEYDRAAAAARQLLSLPKEQPFT